MSKTANLVVLSNSTLNFIIQALYFLNSKGASKVKVVVAPITLSVESQSGVKLVADGAALFFM